METTLPLYEPDVLNVNCRSRLAFDVVSDKWTPLVVYALRRGGRRYNQLRRDVGGVSAKMLSQSLRRLEADGLVERRVTPAVPPEVEYRLTPLGSTLLTPISVLVAWAEDHYLTSSATVRRVERRGPDRWAVRWCHRSAWPKGLGQVNRDPGVTSLPSVQRPRGRPRSAA